MASQKFSTQDDINRDVSSMLLKAHANRRNINTDKLSRYGMIVAEMGYTYQFTINLNRFWLNGFTLREKLHQSFTEVLNTTEQNNWQSKICWQKHADLRNENLTNCTNILAHFQSEYAPDCHYEIQQLSEECFGDKLDGVDPTKINQLMKKIDTETIKQFENALWKQVSGAAFSLLAMMITLRKKCDQIKSSEAYRNCNKLQLSIQRIEEYLEESDSYIKAYNVPSRELTDLISGQELYSAALKDLKYGRRSLNFAKRELDMILLEINAHSKSIEQSRDNHSIGIANNTIRLIGNGIQYMQTPAALVTSAALGLYSLISGIQLTTISGHAFGFYWSAEEMNKLNELKHEMSGFQEKINEIFSTIERIEEKMAHIKEEKIQ